MAYKSIEESRAAIRRHYYANKDAYLERNRRRRRELRDYVNSIKSSTPCTDCHRSFPFYVMDFDHLEDKDQAVSVMIRKNNRRAIEAEILKCEVVCSNCHRMRTFSRMEEGANNTRS